ncbi:MAG: FG-GAP repeat protein, partial [Actinobacteria bacterium]|nr:FG-GAP repeat protein [Actinomycetota bacterium]
MPNTPSRTVGARALSALALLASLCAVAVVGSDPAEAASTAYVLSPRNVQRPRPTRAIDTSGDRVVIGGDGITSNTSTGGVNVFRLVAGTYVLEGSLRPPAPALASGFGETVAIDGDYVVVGAAVADVGGENAGAAFVYRWDGSTWSLQQELVPSVRTVGSQFGRSVDIEGTSVIVGQLGGTIAGRVFTRSGGTWTQQQVLSPAGASPTWQMGTSAAISGTTLVLGGPNATVDGITAAGRLAVFTRSGGTWTEQQALTATAPTTSANLGVDVAIDGDTVVAGAHEPGVGPGSATVFTRSGTTWTQQQVLTPPGGQPLDFFGFAVGVEGDLAVIGAYGDDESALAAGSAYTYSRTGTTWSQVAKLFPAGASSAGSFGSSVGVADGRAVVGSLVNGVPYQDRGAFDARTWDGTAWSAPVVTLPVREEHAGTSVDVSGGVAAVGVPEGWTASGVAGYVVVSYASPSSWTATTPTQVVRLVGAAGDRFGAAVAL